MRPSKHKPINLTQLQAWVDDLRDITFDCKVSALNLQFLTSNDLTDEGAKEFLESGFGLHLRQQYRFTLITQLDKLFSDSPNQERSFVHLFNRLLSHPMDDSISTSALGRTKGWSDTGHMHGAIKNLQKRIHPLKDSIRLVTIHRNAVSAHTAAMRPRVGPTLDDFHALTDEAIYLVNALQRRVSFGTTLFGFLKTFEVKFMVQHVSEAFRYRQQEKVRKG